MGHDDVVFVLLLVGSVVGSALLRLCPTRWRADVAALAGVLAILGACGPNAIHPLTGVLLSAAARRLVPRRWRAGASFALAFGHLTVLRLLPVSPGGPTNAAMLLLTLRLSTAEAESTLELVRYACCYHGLFTGPYVSHAEWHASMRTPRPLPPARSLIRALLAALAALAVWRVVASSLPYQLVSAVDVDAWDTWVPRGVPSVLRGVAGFMSRLFYFHASSYQFRWRFYACWLVMEFSGLLVGLAQPANVDVGACELATSPSQLIGGWNTSVHVWLKQHVYRGLPPRASRVVRQLATFAVSTFWHGLRPGYFLCFAGLFFMVSVEQLVRAAWATRVGDAHAPSTSVAVRLACHLWTMGCLTFYGGAFNLLGGGEILALWRSLRFYGIWLTALPALPAAMRLAWVRTQPRAGPLRIQSKTPRRSPRSRSPSRHRKVE